MADNKIRIEVTKDGYSIKESGFLPGLFLDAYEGKIVERDMTYLVCVTCNFTNYFRVGSVIPDIENSVKAVRRFRSTADIRLIKIMREKAAELLRVRGEGYTLEDTIPFPKSPIP